MSNGNNAMAFGDFAKVLRGWTRQVFDTVTVSAVPTPSQINFQNKVYNTEVLANHNTFEGYYLQFITGRIAGQVYEIANMNDTNIVVQPQFTTEPQIGDIAAITNIRNALSPQIIDLTEIGGTTIDIGPSHTLANNADISGSVSYTLPNEFNFRNSSLYLNVGAAIDITLEFSPAGTTFFEPSESPLVFNAAGDDIVAIDYSYKAIRLTGSNTSSVTAILKGLV